MRRSIGIEALAWTESQLEWEELSAHADTLTARREHAWDNRIYCLRSDAPPGDSWSDLRRTVVPASSERACRPLASLFAGDDEDTAPGIPDVVLASYRMSA